jgi:arabinose-5-phosphate isomerase
MDSQILQIARDTLTIERDALTALMAHLDETFEKVVQLIAQTNGRVIVTGIGKSAIVAQKIVATLNSTGTPSVFMHAADAIHGDLGMIQRNDVVICLSKSGDTPEIKALLPLVKNFGNPLVAFVANQDSFLGKNADFTLLTPIDREADPNNLAPTASTTSQMALGDALATCLLAIKGFSSQDFAQFHPGGALGKQLYLRVRDIYTHHGTPSVSADTNLKNTILEMTSQRLGATAVLDASHLLIGIITDGDLRRLLMKDIDLTTIKAADIMSHTPLSISPDAMAVEVLKIMREKSITQLIVAEGRQYLGMVHLHDLLKEGIA